MKTATLVFLPLLLAGSVYAQQSEVKYLSGTGLNDTVTWKFRCSAGENSGKWTTIEVPSQWELQGFGEYDYGRKLGPDKRTPLNEYGEYRYDFKVPSSWRGKEVKIVFEGVMTDTEVKINGKSAGETHQGGFYRFEYEISSLLRYGSANKLEVTVRKESDNASVNNAERHADWWNFGGIYRPVYLKCTPTSHIEHFALDPKADGSLSVDIETVNAPKGSHIEYSLSELSGRALGTQSCPLSSEAVQRHEMRWDGVKSWDCEHPNLYLLSLSLVSPKGETLHQESCRVGFRTVDFRPKDGLYVNGVKVILKGINRHTFHPEGGRCTDKALSFSDAELIKDMNMNAIRSHYPPDVHFLDVCDSLGIFYLDELAGWHGRYDTEVGSRLVKEMLHRDVNHPCIILWNNGNEGGWNTALDGLFSQYDPQKRHVIHPWADFDELDTHHYPTYLTGVGRFTNGYKVFMPTEFMHANTDQGGGAGLADFWERWIKHPLFAGGFIWAFVDEAVVRTDKGGILDSNFDMGNDGVVGPYREKEGSFFAIRDIWCPIQFEELYITPSFKGKFLITNKYLFSSLDSCRAEYRLKKICSPSEGGTESVSLEGSIPIPPLEPNTSGYMTMDVPEGFFDNDVLEIELFDGSGRSICTKTWPIHYAPEYYALHNKKPQSGKAETESSGNNVSLSAAGVLVKFSKSTGELTEVSVNGKKHPFAGLSPVGIKMQLKDAYSRTDGDDAVFVTRYLGAVDSIVWRLKPDGRLGMDAVLLNRDNGGVRGGFDDGFMDTSIKDLGFTFTYPESNVKGLKWMGRGPYRVWKNRTQGHNIDLWQKAYNNTITGRAEKGKLEYPEFKGYHANIYWAEFLSDNAPLTISSETDGLFLKVYNPQEPSDATSTLFPTLPEGDISLLLDIQAIKSFKSIPQQGPGSQPGNIRIKSGDEGLRVKVWFDFK